MTHRHSTRCPPNCTRETDVDPSTPTGSYRIITGQGYGNRPKTDRPRWWPFVIIAYKAVVQLAGIIGLAWLAKKLGLTTTVVP